MPLWPPSGTGENYILSFQRVPITFIHDYRPRSATRNSPAAVTMDPVTPTAAVRCPVDGCEYHQNVADAALAATLLSIHAQSLHVATPAPAPAPSYTAGATARVEKISGPTVDEGVSLEDWLYFEQRWREYKNATRITGLDPTYQLLDCCNPDGLRKNLVRVHRDSLTSRKENELLTHIRKLARYDTGD